MGLTLDDLLDSWELSLASRNLSAATLHTYATAGRQMAAHLAEQGIHEPGKVTRAHLERWILHLVQTRSASTASNRYRSVQQFWRWCLEQDEIEADPTARMRPPMIPEHDVPILRVVELRQLLAACEGKDVASTRDSAIIRLFVDSGLRLTELSNLAVDDLALKDRICEVTGKGRRQRVVPFGAKTAASIDAYRRARLRSGRGFDGPLWVSERTGQGLASNGIAQMLRRRAKQAGLPHLHPHQLRHTSAHLWLDGGGSESDAMRLYGWRSPQMLRRYASISAQDRAIKSHHRLAPGDQI